MLWYLNQVKRLSWGLHSFTLEQVPRSKNSHADSLATLATSSREKLPRIVLVKDHETPAYDIQVPIRVHFTRVGPSWMDLVVTFLKMEPCPRTKSRQRKSEERHRGFGCPRIKNYKSARIRDLFFMYSP